MYDYDRTASSISSLFDRMDDALDRLEEGERADTRKVLQEIKNLDPRKVSIQQIKDIRTYVNTFKDLAPHSQWKPLSDAVERLFLEVIGKSRFL